MRFIGVEYDRRDVCLPDSLQREIYAVAEEAKNQMVKDLMETCLNLSTDLRRHARIILDRKEDGLKLYVSIPEIR